MVLTSVIVRLSSPYSLLVRVGYSSVNIQPSYVRSFRGCFYFYYKIEVGSREWGISIVFRYKMVGVFIELQGTVTPFTK